MSIDSTKGSVASASAAREKASSLEGARFVKKESWLISRVNNGLYAIPAMLAQTMVVCPEITDVPTSLPFIRGVIDLRGQVMPVIDLRKRMNLKTIEETKEALCGLLDAREEDHKKWLTELEQSIRENRRFNLATDPHQCAFGKWHDNFKTDDLSFAMLLKKFHDPHKKIHEIAATAQKLQQAGDEAGAIALINQTRDGALATMLQLFSDTKALIRQTAREIVIVLEQEDYRVAVTVDNLEAVETLDPAGIEMVPSILANGAGRLVVATARRHSGELILILDVAQLFAESESVEITGLP